jgi:farnesyl-diphosphate farnesyltransferase
LQIEQFIESIFPSQKPGTVRTPSGKLMSPEEIKKKKVEDKEAMWDMVYLGLAVLATLLVVSALMVYILFCLWMSRS